MPGGPRARAARCVPWGAGHGEVAEGCGWCGSRFELAQRLHACKGSRSPCKGSRSPCKGQAPARVAGARPYFSLCLRSQADEGMPRQGVCTPQPVCLKLADWLLPGLCWWCRAPTGCRPCRAEHSCKIDHQAGVRKGGALHGLDGKCGKHRLPAYCVCQPPCPCTCPVILMMDNDEQHVALQRGGRSAFRCHNVSPGLAGLPCLGPCQGAAFPRGHEYGFFLLGPRQQDTATYRL